MLSVHTPSELMSNQSWWLFYDDINLLLCLFAQSTVIVETRKILCYTPVLIRDLGVRAWEMYITHEMEDRLSGLKCTPGLHHTDYIHLCICIRQVENAHADRRQLFYMSWLIYANPQRIYLYIYAPHVWIRLSHTSQLLKDCGNKQHTSL